MRGRVTRAAQEVTGSTVTGGCQSHCSKTVTGKTMEQAARGCTHTLDLKHRLWVLTSLAN